MYIKVPVAFWKFEMEKFYGLMIILFYQGLKEKITHKLVNGGGNALLFLGKYVYKVNIVGVILS